MSDLGKYLLAIDLRAQYDMQNEKPDVEEDKVEENRIEPDDDRMTIDPDGRENVEIGEEDDDEDNDTDSNDEVALDLEDTRKSASVGR